MATRKWAVRLTKEDFFYQSSYINVLEYEVEKDWELHWHDFWELELIVAGRGSQKLNGVDMPLAPGSLFLVTPTDFHEVYPDPKLGMRLVNVKFAAEFVDEELRERLVAAPAPLGVALSGEAFLEAEKECRILLREQATDGIGAKQMKRGALERLLVGLLRTSSEAAPMGSAEAPGERESAEWTAVRRALLYIDHHFRERIALSAIAEQAGLSPNYFSERFRRMTGIPFQNYVLEKRLRYAEKLLLGSALPVTEIGYASGFNALPYFNRAFKKRFGAAPAEVRRNRP